MGEPVLSFLSEHTGTTFNLHKGKNTIVCQSASTNLVAGVYAISCSILHSAKATVGGTIDEIYDAATFAVTDYKAPTGDQYIDQSEALYVVDRTWKQETS